MADVVRYRLGRKESHSTAAGILEEFLTPASPTPPATKTPEQVKGGKDEGTSEEGGGE